MKNNIALRSGALLSLGLSGLLLVGCGGGSNSTPQNVTPANMVALSTNNVLSFFYSQTPYQVGSVTVSGLNSGEQLIGIDYRFAPIAGATTGTGLYGLARTGTSGTARLVRINFTVPGGNDPTNVTSATATAVGTGFTLPFSGSNIGFDFNPVVDRIRVVDSASRTNLRLNPDTGALVDSDTTAAGVQFDGTLTYDSGDSGNGTTPRIVGAAYTNNVVGTASTVNYAIDATRGTLVTQGRPANPAVPDDTAVSPNTGRLFTIATLGTPVGSGDGLGFDIAPASNAAFVAYSPSGNNPRLFSLSLSTGATTGGATISLGGSRPLLGLAVLPAITTTPGV